jgi:hypothetical protein
VRLDPAGPLVRHQVGHRLAAAADDDGRALLFHPRQQAGEVGFRFMDVDRLHGDDVSPVSPVRQPRSAKQRSRTSGLLRGRAVWDDAAQEYMNIFFRVLTPRCGDEPGTIERWKQSKYTSSHCRVPGHWRKKWQQTQSADPDQYELICQEDGCEYTTEAREAFLRIAHLNDDELSKEQRFRAGEYVGVSAFDQAEQALKYGGDGPIGNLKLYVVFEGEKLDSLKEEEHEGGCRVRFTKEIVLPMHRNEFMSWLKCKHTTDKKEAK